MKVAVVTNMDERCGNGEYGRELAAQLGKRFDVTAMPQAPEGPGYDAVVFNWHPAVVWWAPDVGHRLQGEGAKVIVIAQESNPRMDAARFAGADLVTAHEPVGFDGGKVNFRFVHHPAPSLDAEALQKFKDEQPGFCAGGTPAPCGLEPSVGTAGFAFPVKRLDVCVRAALAIGGKAVVIAPAHPWRDPSDIYAELDRIAGAPVGVLGWMSQRDVLVRLACCAMNIYFASDSEAAPGQAGSARMIAAARRPTVMRRCRKTSAIEEFSDELYFVGSEQEAVATAAGIWGEIVAGGTPRSPRRMADAISWDAVGRTYADAVEGLMP